jgi:hypothetical protein
MAPAHATGPTRNLGRLDPGWESRTFACGLATRYGLRPGSRGYELFAEASESLCQIHRDRLRGLLFWSGVSSVPTYLWKGCPARNVTTGNALASRLR